MSHTAFYVADDDLEEDPGASTRGSLHLNVADARAFALDLDAKWHNIGGQQSTQPVGAFVHLDVEAKQVQVDDATYAKLVASKNGIWVTRFMTEAFAPRS